MHFVRNLVISLCSFAYLLSSAQAVDYLTSAEHTFFDPKDVTRIGLEVEFTNMSLEEASQIVQSRLGGTLTFSTVKIPTTIKGYDSSHKPIYNEINNPQYVLSGSSIGDILIKAESNQISDVELSRSKEVILELVTDPITGIEKVEELQLAINDLQRAGATGTSPKTAVSTQVNVEIEKGIKSNAKSIDLLNLMRSYFRPAHREHIEYHEKVPAARKPYVQAYSNGFMRRMLDPEYNPSWEKLYNDYIYRQSLELLDVRDAWTMPIADAKKKLLKLENPIVPRVVKQNALRITSMLGYMMPDDPMTKIMQESGWVKPLPLVEFREWNNVFDVVTPTKRSLGLMSAAKQYGYYDHDSLMAELTGIDEAMIVEIRRRARESEKTGRAFAWRYFLADRKEIDVDDYREHWKKMYEKRDVVGFLSPNEMGERPLFVPGQSVVMHRRPIHRRNIVGKYNPGLINAHIAQALENKYAEAKFFDRYAPGTMPKTTLLSETIGDTASIKKIIESLNREYPNGWILKGVWDLGTEGMLVTDKTDIVADYKAFKSSDFLAFKQRLDKDKRFATAGFEYYIKELSAHPGYSGWRISQLLEFRNLYIAQARMEIVTEFRVEVLGGKVLGNGSTIDRYSYKTGYKTNITPAEIEAVEAYVRKIVADLPENLRGTPFAFDIAKLKNGAFKIVESNPGSNSNFLYEEDWRPSVRALTEYLDAYPQMVGRKEIPEGMVDNEQMRFLEDFFERERIPVKQMYKGFTFSETEILDNEFPVRVTDPDLYTIGDKSEACIKFYKNMK